MLLSHVAELASLHYHFKSISFRILEDVENIWHGAYISLEFIRNNDVRTINVWYSFNSIFSIRRVDKLIFDILSSLRNVFQAGTYLKHEMKIFHFMIQIVLRGIIIEREIILKLSSFNLTLLFWISVKCKIQGTWIKCETCEQQMKSIKYKGKCRIL